MVVNCLYELELIIYKSLPIKKIEDIFLTPYQKYKEKKNTNRGRNYSPPLLSQPDKWPKTVLPRVLSISLHPTKKSRAINLRKSRFSLARPFRGISSNWHRDVDITLSKAKGFRGGES